MTRAQLTNIAICGLFMTLVSLIVLAVVVVPFHPREMRQRPTERTRQADCDLAYIVWVTQGVMAIPADCLAPSTAVRP